MSAPRTSLIELAKECQREDVAYTSVQLLALIVKMAHRIEALENRDLMGCQHGVPLDHRCFVCEPSGIPDQAATALQNRELLSALMKECSTSDAAWEYGDSPGGLKIYMSGEMLDHLRWLTRGWDGEV